MLNTSAWNYHARRVTVVFGLGQFLAQDIIKSPEGMLLLFLSILKNKFPVGEFIAHDMAKSPEVKFLFLPILRNSYSDGYLGSFSSHSFS